MVKCYQITPMDRVSGHFLASGVLLEEDENSISILTICY